MSHAKGAWLRTWAWLIPLLLVGGLWATKIVTHTTPVMIVSGSMRPSLRIDDIVLAQPQATYRKNDIIAVDARGEGTPERITVHRLQGINPDGTLVTKGDYNDSVDHWKLPLTRQRIIGKVVAQSPPHAGAWLDQGFWAYELQNSRFYFGIAGLLVLLLAVILLLNGDDRSGRHARATP